MRCITDGNAKPLQLPPRALKLDYPFPFLVELLLPQPLVLLLLSKYLGIYTIYEINTYILSG
jgi:hypothetical protein